MKVAIDKIKVAERIRKQTSNIEELAGNIKGNGLINPITVMSVSGDGYQLIAGLRRLRAARVLGWDEIEATVVPPKGAEEALKIEYSENEQREAFTFSEKMDYARLIEEIESAKAKERMSIGGQGGIVRDHLEKGSCICGRTNSKVGPKVGMSGATYARAKYLSKNAPSEIIEQLDNGKKTIMGAYEELRKKAPSSDEDISINPKDKINILNAMKAVSPDISEASLKPSPVSDLERAVRAERELDAMKYRQHNEIYHRDSIIENLKKRVAELESELEAANARIKELEAGSYEAGQRTPIPE